MQVYISFTTRNNIIMNRRRPYMTLVGNNNKVIGLATQGGFPNTTIPNPVYHGPSEPSGPPNPPEPVPIKLLSLPIGTDLAGATVVIDVELAQAIAANGNISFSWNTAFIEQGVKCNGGNDGIFLSAGGATGGPGNWYMWISLAGSTFQNPDSTSPLGLINMSTFGRALNIYNNTNIISDSVPLIISSIDISVLPQIFQDFFGVISVVLKDTE